MKSNGDDDYTLVDDGRDDNTLLNNSFCFQTANPVAALFTSEIETFLRHHQHDTRYVTMHTQCQM